MHDLSLYGHARMVSVAVEQAAVALCVSRVAPRAVPRGRLLLLHGNPANMYDFGRLAALLSHELEVVALDLPGFGKSESLHPPRHGSLLDSYARHVMGAIDRLGWNEPFYLLGHSHGGAVAQGVAALFPERIRGLILLASVGTPAHWGYRQLVVPGVMTSLRVLAKALKRPSPRRLRRRIVRAVMEPIFAPAPLTDAWVDRELAVVDGRPEILVTMALVASGDPCGQLARGAARIRSPSLFVHGDADRLIPVANSRRLYDTIAQASYAEFHELNGAGHMLHISHADRIAELVHAWLQRMPE
jgi:pimeloyl-ACP methyl ester carboxylesterase